VGNDALGHIAEVGGPLSHIPAETGEHLLEGGKGVEDGPLTGAARLDAGVHVVDEPWVLRHHGLRFEHGLRFSPGLLPPFVQFCGNGCECCGDRGTFGCGIRRARSVSRLAEGIRHPQHRTECDRAPDAYAVQFSHEETPLSIPCDSSIRVLTMTVT
jgi:hypothetical protein